MIERALAQTGMKFCRYDGTMSRGKRDQVLSNFADDPSLHLILVSITCGGQGYVQASSLIQVLDATAD
jgi:SNF2 family DNA or RNA helicase